VLSWQRPCVPAGMAEPSIALHVHAEPMGSRFELEPLEPLEPLLAPLEPLLLPTSPFGQSASIAAELEAFMRSVHDLASRQLTCWVVVFAQRPLQKFAASADVPPHCVTLVLQPGVQSAGVMTVLPVPPDVPVPPEVPVPVPVDELLHPLLDAMAMKEKDERTTKMGRRMVRQCAVGRRCGQHCRNNSQQKVTSPIQRQRIVSES
jgi:hypothetical protein